MLVTLGVVGKAVMVQRFAPAYPLEIADAPQALFVAGEITLHLRHIGLQVFPETCQELPFIIPILPALGPVVKPNAQGDSENNDKDLQ